MEITSSKNPKIKQIKSLYRRKKTDGIWNYL